MLWRRRSAGAARWRWSRFSVAAGSREVSDTVRFIAGMSQFIVVDMTDASSVPLELQATIPDLMVPVMPIVKSGQPVFSMFSDLQRRYFWIQQPVSYDSAQQLVEHVDEAIIVRAQQAAEEIRARRADSVRSAVNVARIASVTARRADRVRPSLGRARERPPYTHRPISRAIAVNPCACVDS